MVFTRKLSFLVFLLRVLISLKNQLEAETNRKGPFQNEENRPPSDRRKLQQEDDARDHAVHRWLRYDYYSETCPSTEQIIRSAAQELYDLRPEVSPALLKLLFHGCFVEGCEKKAPPNESLKGFDFIDIIKSQLEEECLGLVSCADILARESVLLAGGPFYPLYTGRKDGTDSYYEVATYELPGPQDDLFKTIKSFASRGFEFDERDSQSTRECRQII